MRSWMSFGCCAFTLAGCAVGVSDDAAICEQVATHLAECGSALSWSASSCDETAAEVALLLSCDALESSATLGKADEGSECMTLCEAEGADEARCGRLCRALNGQRQIGDTCEESGECESSYCHPVYRMCTEQCAGFCPGEDTFCIADPRAAEAGNTLGGFCVIKAESSDDCGRLARYRTSCYSHTVTDSLEAAARHVGDSGVPSIPMFVCAPQIDSDYQCDYRSTENDSPRPCYYNSPSCGFGGSGGE